MRLILPFLVLKRRHPLKGKPGPVLVFSLISSLSSAEAPLVVAPEVSMFPVNLIPKTTVTHDKMRFLW